MSKEPIVIDLFAGVGGLSLGAARAGFKVGAAVEIDKFALATHGINFPNTAHVGKDIGSLSAETLLSDVRLKAKSVDGLIGGPPCQGFSSMGRRQSDDPRNSLLGSFFRLVDEIRPKFFLAENVLGLLAERNAGILEQALSLLPKNYRLLTPLKIKANEYGAPTTRTRVFFIGYDPDRMNSMDESDFQPLKERVDIRVANALINLPSLQSHWATEQESWRVVGELGNSGFHKRMKGFVPKNVGNREAINALRRKRLVSGFLGTVHTPETVLRFAQLKHGEVDAVSKSLRLDPKGYCPTLRAGTGPERGSYQAVRPVHPSSPRVICPREAARLQGFPDWFQFHPTKWHAFRQIGNSVSPIVSESLLKAINGKL